MDIYFILFSFRGDYRFDIEPDMEKYICQMTKYSDFVHKYEFDIEEHSLIFHMTPASGNTSIEIRMCDLFAVGTVYSHDLFAYRADDTIR